MRRKIGLLITVLLVVAMLSCSLIACSKDNNNNAQTDEGPTELVFGDKKNPNNKYIDVTPTTAFVIVSKTAKSNISDNIVITKLSDKSKVVTNISAVDSTGLRFKVYAPVGYYEEGQWYTIEIKNDNDLSFATYPGSRKLTFRASTGNVNAEMCESVIYVGKEFVKVSPVDENKGYGTILLNTKASQIIPEDDAILMVEDEEINETAAYRVLSISDTGDGYANIKYNIPRYNDIYKSLVFSQKSVLNSSVQENVEFSDFEEIKENLSQLAEKEIGVGNAKFEINASLNDDIVAIEVKMTIPDLIKTEKGGNYLDLILSFTIESKITADTNVSIGDLVAAKDKGLSVKASFDNTLKFRAEISDDVNLVKKGELDAILNKIKNMIDGEKENDVEINVFNWVIPIGNGIAAVNFDVAVVMDFTFSGELGVESSSNCKFDTTVSYDPDVEDAKKFNISVTKPTFEFESVSADFNASVKTRVGLEAEVTFDLLAGVLKFGVGAEVGNYNDIYAGIATNNLLNNDFDLSYGYYFEGGVYYDVKIIYGLLNLISGKPSVFSGRQYKDLYHAGHQEQVTKIYSSYIMAVGAEFQDIEIYVDQTNLVSGAKSTNVLVDSSKVTLAEASDYVAIENGKIKMLENGFNQVSQFGIKVSIDGLETEIFVRAVNGIKAKTTDNKITIDMMMTLSDDVVVSYLGSDDALDAQVNGQMVTIDGASVTKAGTIVIKDAGRIVGYVYVE